MQPAEDINKDANESISTFSQNQKLQIKVQNNLNFKVSSISKFKFQIVFPNIRTGIQNKQQTFKPELIR